MVANGRAAGKDNKEVPELVWRAARLPPAGAAFRVARRIAGKELDTQTGSI